MIRFDEDTATPIDLLKPEFEPQNNARGIGIGVLLAIAMWIAIFALGVAVWGWMH